jgi:ribosomal protein S18 acetylase RimI-like enzyme
MQLDGLIFQQGLPEVHRECAATLYDEAFGQKFKVAVRSEKIRRSLLKRCFQRDHAFVAIAGDKLVGIAGFHTVKGSFTGGMTYEELISLLGFVAGSWAAVIFSFYERTSEKGVLLMDGIAVHRDFRGVGIGGKLLDELVAYAEKNKYEKVRLDVIETNPKAKKLYERVGFGAVGTQRFPYLRWLLGFGGSTTMELNVQTRNKRTAS